MPPLPYSDTSERQASVKQTSLTILVLLASVGGIGVQRGLLAQAGQGTTPPLSTFSAPAWSDIPLNPNQPDRVTYWSVDTFAKVHAELASRAAKGQPLNARDLLPLPMTPPMAIPRAIARARNRPAPSSTKA